MQQKSGNTYSLVYVYRNNSKNQTTLNTEMILRKRKTRRKSKTDEKMARCPHNNPAISCVTGDVFSLHCFYYAKACFCPVCLCVSICTRLRISARVVFPRQSSFSFARLLTSLVLFKIRSTQYSSKSNDWANAVTMTNLGIAGLSELRSF